jgi:LuxR family transcriptional regulator, positive regulator of biofilm formation
MVGADSPANGALSYVFEKENCSKCVIVRGCELIPVEQSSADQGKRLILLDCLADDFDRKLKSLVVRRNPPAEIDDVALFNLHKGTGVERKAIMKGIRGFFYCSDSLAHVLKGLHALHRGEIWMSRDILVQAVLQGRKKRAPGEKDALSYREIEILSLASTGSNNEDIAEKLSISPNTVKVHLYRIFKKIKVPNRFQATLWAAKNL